MPKKNMTHMNTLLHFHSHYASNFVQLYEQIEIHIIMPDKKIENNLSHITFRSKYFHHLPFFYISYTLSDYIRPLAKLQAVIKAGQCHVT